jgi:hypothetical protein
MFEGFMLKRAKILFNVPLWWLCGWFITIPVPTNHIKILEKYKTTMMEVLYISEITDIECMLYLYQSKFSLHKMVANYGQFFKRRGLFCFCLNCSLIPNIYRHWCLMENITCLQMLTKALLRKNSSLNWEWRLCKWRHDLWPSMPSISIISMVLYKIAI